MRFAFFAAAATILILSGSAFAQKSSTPKIPARQNSQQQNAAAITGGRFFIERGAPNLQNARLETADFTATSFVLAGNGNGWDVCTFVSNPQFCLAGTAFNVPSQPIFTVGFCTACNPPQFPRGTFTINGTTYENVFFTGEFRFSQARFTVAPRLLAKRKKLARFRSGFTMTGDFQVCKTADNLSCRPEDVIYSTQISGRGTLTFSAKILVDPQISTRPFLQRESIEYKFEP